MMFLSASKFGFRWTFSGIIQDDLFAQVYIIQKQHISIGNDISINVCTAMKSRIWLHLKEFNKVRLKISAP